MAGGLHRRHARARLRRDLHDPEQYAAGECPELEEHCRRRAVVLDERNADRPARRYADQAWTAVGAAAGKPSGKSTSRGAAAAARSRRAATASLAAVQQAG